MGKGIDWSKHAEKPEVKAETLHRFETAIGICPECGVEVREPDKLVAKLPDILPKLRELIHESTKGKKIVCENCGVGLADNAKEVATLDNCFWCRHPNAVRREVFEEKKKH